MHYLSVRPLSNFLESHPRDYITWPEFTNLERQVKKRCRTEVVSQTATKHYLALFGVLRFEFIGQAKLNREALCARVDSWLRQKNIFYTRNINPPATNNVFTPQEFHSKNFTPKIYDLSYYNSVTQGHEGGHHPRKKYQGDYLRTLRAQIKNIIASTKDEDNESALAASAQKIVKLFESQLNVKGKIENWSNNFYIRCEEFAETVLYGNLQIDQKNLAKELDNEDPQAAMFSSRNIYCHMVQEAVLHALELGKTRILFQAGQAAEYAQWGHRQKTLTRELVTPENIKVHEEIWLRDKEEFAKMRLGQTFSYHQQAPLIIEKITSRNVRLRDPQYGVLLPAIYHLAHKYGYGELGLNFMQAFNSMTALNNSWLRQGPDLVDQLKTFVPRVCVDDHGVVLQRDILYRCHLELYETFQHYFVENDLAKALTALNMIFSMVTGLNYNQNSTAKLQALGELRNARRYPGYTKNSYLIINKFLLEFNYQAQLLEKFPELQYTKTDKGSEYFFLGPVGQENLRPMPAPQVNDFSPYNSAAYLAKRPTSVLSQRQRISGIYNWYENVLPEVLTMLHLPYKKTIISRRHKDKTYRAYAWEITAPLPTLRKKLRIMF